MFRFIATFLIVALAGVGAVAALAVGMQPYTGSQTRLGGYLESDYGWSGNQIYHATNLFEEVNSVADADGHDVLVIGDSFSVSPNNWVNYFVERTGIDTVVVQFSRVDMGALPDTIAALARPPRLVVIASQEGRAAERLSLLQQCEVSTVTEVRALTPIIAPGPVPGGTVPHLRETDLDFATKFDIALSYARKILGRAVLGAADVVPLQVNLPNAFSGPRSDMFLSSPSRRPPYSSFTVAGANRGLKCLGQALAAHGTGAAAVIFPPAIQAYRDHLADVRLREKLYEPLAPQLIDIAPAISIDLLTPLRTAIASGSADIYLADDHHTGTAGFTVATDAIILQLVAARLLATSEQVASSHEE